MSQPPPPSLHEQIRSAIQSFLQERLQDKLDGLKAGQDNERDKHLTAFQPENWLAVAANRVEQIQQATHVLKYTNPDAKVAKKHSKTHSVNLNAKGNPHVGEGFIGTHSLGDIMVLDVAGNAAALDVYKFLSITVDGQTLLQRCIDHDPALAAAFSDNPETSQNWMEAFANLAQPKGKPASHTLAKQIYWPLGQGQYHLLSPLFPTSLAHTVWARLYDDRFSDKAKAARQARRDHQPHPHGYCEYPNLAIQKFGGTKPQNISQLNTERHGENWLLPSLPPVWQSDPVRPPLGVESVFPRRFGRRRTVRELVDVLKKFLESVEGPQHNNIHIRNKRAELVRYILDELLQYAAEIQTLEGGWSQAEACKLNLPEQYWLDPKRAETDPDFATQWQRGDWQDAICHRFGQWLNAALRTDKLLMGLPESQEWQTVLDDELRMIRLELNHG